MKCKEVNKGKEQTYKEFYLSLLSLPCHYRKRRLAETNVCFHFFRNIIVAVTIICFSKEKRFPGLFIRFLHFTYFHFAVKGMKKIEI